MSEDLLTEDDHMTDEEIAQLVTLILIGRRPTLEPAAEEVKNTITAFIPLVLETRRDHLRRLRKAMATLVPLD